MSLLNGSPTWMYNAGGDFYPYKLDQSLRFNAADTPRLTKTWGQAATDDGTWTISMWVKRGSSSTWNTLYAEESQAWTTAAFYNDTLYVQINAGGAGHYIQTNRLFRDFSSWYHIVVAFDEDNGTAAHRLRLYINGTEETSFSTDQRSSISSSSNSNWNTNGKACAIGARSATNNSLNFDGYIAEFHNIDGQQLTPSAFGETKEGIWIPKQYTGTYGNNGFYLKYVASAEGTDSSGNSNNWTWAPGNTSRNRPTPDTPTNNFCLIPYSNNPTLLAKEHQGMRLNTTRTGYWDGAYGSFSVKSGKWYYEVQMNETAGDNFRVIPGWKQQPEEELIVFNRLGTSGDPLGTSSNGFGNKGHYAYLPWSTNFAGNGGYTGTKAAASRGDVLNVAVDFDNNKIYFGLNGTYAANDGGTDGDPANGTNESLSGLYNNGKFYSPSVLLRNDSSAGSNSARFNFGHDRSFGANLSLGTAYADENGFGEFRYAVPSGFLALCSQNLPDPEVDPNDGENPTDYFNTILYSATANAAGSVTGYGFAPDWLWTKARNATQSHQLFDTLRGDGVRLITNSGNAESALGATYVSLENDGFDYGSTTFSSNTYVGWGWKAGGSPSSNSNGSITSSVSANTDAGFSIVSYTGNGGSSATIGHGLTSAPDLILLKNRSAGEGWVSFWDTYGMGPTKFLNLNGTGTASSSSGEWNNTAPTNTVFTIGNQGRVNTNNHNYIAYCFHNVEGYQKVGTWEGNANADGPTINCGFRPAFVFMKNQDDSENWLIYDNKRDPFNVTDEALLPNSNSASGGSANAMDFLSTGFKLRSSAGSLNGTSKTFVFLAIAEQPLKYANAK